MTLFWQLVLNGIVAGALYSMVAVSFALVFGSSRHFHIAHGAVLATAGYIAYATAQRGGAPLSLAIVAGIAAATVLGAALVLGVYIPIERRGGEGFVLFLVSLGALILIENTFTLWLGAAQVSLEPGGALKEPIRFLGLSLTLMQLILIVVACACFGALLALLACTRLGKDIRALASNPELVSILGRRPEWIKVGVYAIASAMVGLAGVYQVLDTGVKPGVGTNLVIFAFVAVILGGIGSVSGAFAASMLLGLLQNVSQLVIAAEWSSTVVFVTFLVIITIAPTGLASLHRRVLAAVRGGRPVVSP